MLNPYSWRNFIAQIFEKKPKLNKPTPCVMQNILIFPPIYEIKRSKFDDEMKKKKSHDFRKVKFSPILWTMHKYTNQIIKKKQNKTNIYDNTSFPTGLVHWHRVARTNQKVVECFHHYYVDIQVSVVQIVMQECTQQRIAQYPRYLTTVIWNRHDMTKIELLTSLKHTYFLKEKQSISTQYQTQYFSNIKITIIITTTKLHQYLQLRDWKYGVRDHKHTMNPLP